MKLRFWGTRGSIPVALTVPDIRRKLMVALRGASGRQLDSDDKIAAYIDALGFDVAGTFGGHSSCVELTTAAGDCLIFDMGSGARPLGQHLLARPAESQPQLVHVFMSHLHWDHIMGFPFFGPAYVPGKHIIVHGCHVELEAALRSQQEPPSFPVDFSCFGSRIEFDVMPPEQTLEIAGVRVRAIKQLHGGDSYGYRVEADGKSFVYSTDGEHKLEDVVERQRMIDFYRDADLVIFDGMYSLADAVSVRADWGHSSNIIGVELCQAAGAKCLCLYHHEPAHDDVTIAATLAETRRFEEITRDGEKLDVMAAYDGLELDL